MTETNKKSACFFITGGGTGGHIYPAIAIAKALKQDNRSNKIFYIGNPDNLEKELAQKENFDFLNVDIYGMPRKLGLDLIVWFFKLFSATMKSIFYIQKYNPDLIFGTGGYVSAPALFGAIITNTPFAIHDCDSEPGIVSKIVAPYAKFVSVAFENSKKLLNNKNIYFNGNPIRVDFLKYDKQRARKKLGIEDKLTILVMGGSQGARTLNNAIIQALPDLFKNFDVQVIHQTGKKNYEDAINELEKYYPDCKRNKNCIVKPYFDEMYLPLLASDIVVSRAGSLSISEICASGCASILVPFPYAAADHQRKNAKEMESKNAALYLEDSDCNAASLLEKLKCLIEKPEELTNLQSNAEALARPNATENLICEIKELI